MVDFAEQTPPLPGQETTAESLLRLRREARISLKAQWKSTKDVAALRTLAISLREAYRDKINVSTLDSEQKKIAWGWWDAVIVSGAENLRQEGVLNGILDEARGDKAVERLVPGLQALIKEEQAVLKPLVGDGV